MNKSQSDSYKRAGVDITEGYRAVELMKKHVARTMIPGADEGLGGFGGLFAPDLKGISAPILVSGTDGVGTKLKLAFLMDRHDTVGIDCVAMCVNDVICCGARPLFFLDYIALGRNVAEKVAEIVGGIADGCVQAGCALIGGETAEMPGFYQDGEYDLAGFSVGLVDRSRILDKERVRPGDVILGLPSSGIHANGYSLVRKTLDVEHADLNAPLEALEGRTLGDVLLEPTRIYVRPVLELLSRVSVRSLAHITGGGFYENIPRSLPAGMAAKIRGASLEIPPVFELIRRTGHIPERDMFNTFNMGVGMTAIVAAEDAEEALRALAEEGLEARVIGEVVTGEKEVIFC
ncbi:MAG: phosphoribosylformylglycinamidine cyclo-ligase [Bacillota bacterium]|jgi:phosphoribosylformylglycinamidine cyclo-ligase|nr:phosphoribosylformylglycinamidine cyclo-ligase [Eubacteriales bacterium]MDI9491822.1 phosphoribosylformylglycinamidine cyclo-ligase [Bacillota bacterium]NLV70237.1 phosphoribosylformylglycinamidine cyclo-ligase [Clostridiales bacterium]MDD3536811.1 phosphoribosylformylglycinamidine cyclo-ligase [Eubacteriales bacterium]MDD4285499.1 phosphoribosylformylglycinamidine cyclo-ligase [Eubacteriales bacterium]